MMETPHEPHDVARTDAVLTAAQEAALARLFCAVTGAVGRGAATGGISLLCGPAGTGKTTLARRLGAGLATEVRPLAAWLDATTLPDLVVADDAHETDAATLAGFIARCAARRPAAGLVLVGEGRLLTLVSRDPRIERAIGLRAILRPCTPADTRDLLVRHGGHAVAAVQTVHEITGGIAVEIIRLAGLAGILADSRPGGRLEPADIEVVQRRLTPACA
jgi:hypothetical protein